MELVEDVGHEATKNEVLVDATGEIQRLPVPSSDPNDPLNLARWEKFGIILSCCWFCRFIFPLLSENSTNMTKQSCPCR